jgi:hypothetical protein
MRKIFKPIPQNYENGCNSNTGDPFQDPKFFNIRAWSHRGIGEDGEAE